MEHNMSPLRVKNLKPQNTTDEHSYAHKQPLWGLKLNAMPPSVKYTMDFPAKTTDQIPPELQSCEHNEV